MGMDRREYIKIPKSSPMPVTLFELKELNDDVWKNEIFHHLLSFYQNYDSKELKDKIEQEKKKAKPQIENQIALYIRRYLNKDKFFSAHFDVVGENRNDDSNKEGFYDITTLNTYWVEKGTNNKVRFHFECKNLDKSQDLVNKYVCYNKGHSVFDGGVYRYFNGKYAQNLNFGGMIGFVLDGNISEIKSKIAKKLNDKFDITPEGDIVSMTDNSIEENHFTFETVHQRKNKLFIIHHLLFDFKF